MTEVIVAIIGVMSVIVTYLVAPRWEANRKARAAAVEDAQVAKRNELDAIRAEAAELRADLKSQLADVRTELANERAKGADKDARIAVLEVKVERFEKGLTHPPGYVLLPANVWSALRNRLGDQLPPGPFVGEEEPPRFGNIGLRD